MNKTLLIFRHEFLHTIKRAGFIILTLVVPILGFLGIGIFQLVSSITEPSPEEISTIGYVDELGGLDDFTTQGAIELVPYDTRNDATAALINREVSEYIVIPRDHMFTGQVSQYTLEKQLETPPAQVAAIKNFITSNLLADNVPPETIYLIEAPLFVSITRLDETGNIAADQGGYGNVLIPAIFSVLLAFSLNFSANYFIQGLGEEKENRLIEVLLSSVSPRQLLIGKILGLGVAGMVQVAVWLVSLPILLNMASSTIGGFFSTIQLPANFVVFGIVYFVLGYLLFAVLSAGVGAISAGVREGQQLSIVYSLFAFVPLWFSSLLFVFPDSPIWTALSIFPVTAPVATILRLGVSDIPAWELAVSIGVLALSVVGFLWLSIKAFRVYLLMYGKRPGLGDLIRNLRSG
jgi:ABC-2 type transport system permease protein